MKILEGTVERGDSDKVFFEKPKGDRNDYLRDVRAVQKYVPRLKRYWQEQIRTMILISKVVGLEF